MDTSQNHQSQGDYNLSSTGATQGNQNQPSSLGREEEESMMIQGSASTAATARLKNHSNMNNNEEEDCVGLGLFFDDNEISALDMQLWEQAAAQVREDAAAGAPSPPPPSRDDMMMEVQQQQEDNRWIADYTIREQDAIINHPRRPKMVGQTAWLELRGPRRMLSDDEVNQLVANFESTEKLLQHTQNTKTDNDDDVTMLKPRLLYRERADGSDGKKKYKYRMASIKEIRTNVNAKRSTKLTYQNSDSSSVVSNASKQATATTTAKLSAIVNKVASPTTGRYKTPLVRHDSDITATSTASKYNNKQTLTRGDSETTAASSKCSAVVDTKNKTTRKRTSEQQKKERSTASRAAKSSHDREDTIMDQNQVRRSMKNVPLPRKFDKKKISESGKVEMSYEKPNTSSQKMTLRSIISWYSDLLDDLEEDIVETRIMDSAYDFKKTLDAFMAVPYSDEIPESPVAIQGYHEIHLAINALWQELYSLYLLDMDKTNRSSSGSSASSSVDESEEEKADEGNGAMSCDDKGDDAGASTIVTAFYTERKSRGNRKGDREKMSSRGKSKSSRHRRRRKRKAGRSMRLNRQSIRSKTDRWDEMSNSGDELPRVDKIKNKKDTSAENAVDLDREFERMDIVETSDSPYSGTAAESTKHATDGGGDSNKKDGNNLDEAVISPRAAATRRHRNKHDAAIDITYSPASASTRPKKRLATTMNKTDVNDSVEGSIFDTSNANVRQERWDEVPETKKKQLTATSGHSIEKLKSPPPPPFQAKDFFKDPAPVTDFVSTRQDASSNIPEDVDQIKASSKPASREAVQKHRSEGQMKASKYKAREEDHQDTSLEHMKPGIGMMKDTARLKDYGSGGTEHPSDKLHDPTADE